MCVLGGGLACTDLRSSDEAARGEGVGPEVVEPPDGKGRTPSDASVVPSEAGADAGTRLDASVPCDGPCPPELLVSGLRQATTMTVDATNLYVAEEGGANGAVYQCPKAGCGASPVKLGEGYAFGIVVLAGTVYWGDFYTGRVVACAIGGCANMPTPIASNQTSVRGVWSDGVSLFWSTSDTGGSIMRCSPAACTPTLVASNVGTVLRAAADQNRVVWTAGGSVKTCIATSCASPVTLGPGTTDVTAHAGNAYWIVGGAKNVVRCSIASGCNGAPLTIGSSQAPSSPVSDGASVYWRDDFYDQIYRCPASGCAPTPVILATKQRGQPGGNIALDGQHVYWTTTSGVYRLPK